uniref:Uncharacterized protein n=1 Tax=Anguilla anguilla TaxID=7936 RepID=A0A0E9X626_ANGAN
MDSRNVHRLVPGGGTILYSGTVHEKETIESRERFAAIGLLLLHWRLLFWKINGMMVQEKHCDPGEVNRNCSGGGRVVRGMKLPHCHFRVVKRILNRSTYNTVHRSPAAFMLAGILNSDLLDTK